MKQIILVVEEPVTHDVLASRLGKEYNIVDASDREHCLTLLQMERPEFVFIELDVLQAEASGSDYREGLQPFLRLYPTLDIIVIAERENVREAMKAVKAGARDYLTSPLEPNEIGFVLDNIKETNMLRSELDYLRDQFWRPESHSVLRTNSLEMKKVFDKVQSVAPTTSTVLLTGETGVGKGVIANLIHQHSQRRQNQFISVHCGAIPETLLESELFGHEKGAFTGAVRRKPGKFEIASGGTIFLDEIGTLPPAMQVKLLQVLQDRTFQRIGGEASLEADVRIIAATNADLKVMCEQGAFRVDLYYRLHVFPIEIPPLRDRLDDVPLLVDLFLSQLNRYHHKGIEQVDADVLCALQSYPWPGNIRELENLIERAYILESSPTLTAESFPTELFGETGMPLFDVIDTSKSLDDVRKQEIARIERRYLEKLLREHGGKIKSTAAAAEIGVRQLHKLMSRHNLNKEDFKNR